MAEYAGRLPLFHIDLYRLADATDALTGGLIDDRQSAGVTLIEWPERLGPALPAERLDVVIDGSGDEPRSITLRAVGDGPRRYLEAVPMTGGARGRASSWPSTAPRRGSSWRSARPAGELLDAAEWPAGYRHGETLLPAIDDLLRPARGRPGRPVGGRRRDRSGRLHRAARRDRHRQGPGPGARLPDRRHLDGRGPAGRAATGRRAAAPRRARRTAWSRRAAARRGCCRPATEPDVAPGTTLVAVDLPGRAPDDALARGETARAKLGASLHRARRGAAGHRRRRRPGRARARST